MMTMSNEAAHAAGWDAGSARMRAEGRTAWSRSDYQAAVKAFNRAYPIEHHLLDLGEAAYWASVERLLTKRSTR